MRVVTFNIMHGRSPSDDRVDLHRFAEAIRTLDADVLALQEVDRDQPRSLNADLTRLAAEAMGATDYRFVAALSGTPRLTWQVATGHENPGTPSYGNAFLSRYPVRRWQVLRLPPLRVPVPRWHGRLRPDIVRDEARVAVMATVQRPGGDVLIASTHLSFLSGWNVVQLRRLMSAISTQSGPVILMGDLNMKPSVAGRLTGLEALAATHLTFPAHEPERQIDHILGRGLDRNGPGEAVGLPLSDHRALAVDLPDPAVGV